MCYILCIIPETKVHLSPEDVIVHICKCSYLKDDIWGRASQNILKIVDTASYLQSEHTEDFAEGATPGTLAGMRLPNRLIPAAI